MARSLRYNDFTGGDWGDSDASVAPRNRFKAKNMMVCRDGTICPRPGLREVTADYTSLPTGEILGYGWSPDSTTRIYFVIGTTVHHVPADSAGAAGTYGTIAAAPTKFHLPQETNRVDIGTDSWLYLAFKGSGLYRVLLAAGTWEQVYADTDIIDLTRSLNRLYAVGGYELRYTDFDDFTAWTAGNTTKVGFTYAPRAVVDTGFGLYVFRQGDGLWYITGDVDTGGYRVSNLHGEQSPGHTSTRYDRKGQATWIPQDRKAPIVVDRQVVDDKSLNHLRTWCDSEPGDHVGVAYTSEYEDLVFVHELDDKGLACINDVWVELDFETPVSKCVCRISTNRFSLSDGGGAGVTPRFYRWQPSLGRPGFTSDAHAAPGDATDVPLDAHLYLPEIVLGDEDNEGSGIVETVEVEFVSWDTGTTETAHFDLVVRTWDPVGEGGQSGVRDSAVQSFDEAVAESATTGTRQRLSFEFGDQGRGRRQQIRFENVRSVSIKEITVNVDDTARVNC